MLGENVADNVGVRDIALFVLTIHIQHITHSLAMIKGIICHYHKVKKRHHPLRAMPLPTYTQVISLLMPY